jgi:hypothetical protein
MLHGSRVLITFATLVAALCPTSNDLQAGPRDHNGGFFLRLSAGGGGAASEIKDVNGLFYDQFKFSGASGDVNFAIGAIVTPNLALHGTLWGWSLNEPDVEIDGVDQGSASNTDLSLGAIGAGLTYYIMPANIYLSGSLGLGSLSLDTGFGEGDTDAGIVIDATIGKEWWVGNRWGLGAAVGLGLHAIPGGVDSQDWEGGSVALRFSATYN